MFTKLFAPKTKTEQLKSLFCSKKHVDKMINDPIAYLDQITSLLNEMSIEELKNFNPNTRCKCNRKDTLLTFICSYPYYDTSLCIIKKLIEVGADVNMHNDQNFVPLTISTLLSLEMENLRCGFKIYCTGWVRYITEAETPFYKMKKNMFSHNTIALLSSKRRSRYPASKIVEYLLQHGAKHTVHVRLNYPIPNENVKHLPVTSYRLTNLTLMEYFCSYTITQNHYHCDNRGYFDQESYNVLLKLLEYKTPASTFSLQYLLMSNVTTKYIYKGALKLLETGTCPDLALTNLTKENSHNLMDTVLLYLCYTYLPCDDFIDFVNMVIKIHPGSINYQNSRTESALSILIHKYVLSVDLVKILLEAGADPNIESNCAKTCCKQTVLMHLAHSCSNKTIKPIIKLLLRYGANINQIDDRGNTALILASINYNKNNDNMIIVKTLLRCGADPNIENDAGNTFDFYLDERALRSLGMWNEPTVSKRITEPQLLRRIYIMEESDNSPPPYNYNL